MADNADKKHWVFRATVADRAGALTSIASAFSNRGISLKTVVGHGAAFPNAPGGAVMATFWCTEAESEEIVRVVKRLSKVTSLEEHPYESEQLRKSAVLRVTRRLAPRDVAGQRAFLTCELMQEKESTFMYFIAGPPSELDPILGRFVEEGIIIDIVYSIIGT